MKKVLLLVTVLTLSLSSCTDSKEVKLREKLGKTVYVTGVGDVEYKLAYTFEREFTKTQMLEFDKWNKEDGSALYFSDEVYASVDNDQMFDRYRIFQTYKHPATGEQILIRRKYNSFYIVR